MVLGGGVSSLSIGFYANLYLGIERDAPPNIIMRALLRYIIRRIIKFLYPVEEVYIGYRISRPYRKGGEYNMLELTCTNEEKIKVTVVPTTRGGVPVALDGLVSVSIQSGEGDVALVDDTSFYLISGLSPGDTTYLVEADADLGDGVQTISDIITLKVEGALASSLGLFADMPELK